MERFAKRSGAGAAVLILSNDLAYWSPRRRPDTIDAAFDLADLRQLAGTLSWSNKAGVNTVKGRTDPLIVAGSYDLRCLDFSNVGGPGGQFRYLYVPVATPRSIHDL